MAGLALACLFPAPAFAQGGWLGRIGGMITPSPLDNPQEAGLDPTTPPDLDEPELGEDPETAFRPQEPAPAAPRPRHAQGQRHGAPAPLPLAARLRRVLRDSLLGGGMDIWFTRAPAKDVYFLAFEAAPRGRYATLGAKHAVRGDLSTPGWRFLSTLGIKVAAYTPSLGQRVSTLDALRMMPGYEWQRGRLTLGLYAGPSHARTLTQGLPPAGRFGRFGAAAQAEFWYDWGTNGPLGSRFTAGYVLADSASASATLALRHGVALPVLPFVIGPEAMLGAGRRLRAARLPAQGAYRQKRLGLHASEIPLFAARLRVSLGAEWRPRRAPGAYAEIAGYIAY